MRPIECAASVRSERGKMYERGPGQHAHGFRQVGRAWSAVLSQWFGFDVPDIPPHIVGLMMVALKTVRASTPIQKRDDDSYVDAHVYADLAYEIDPTMSHPPEKVTRSVRQKKGK